MRFILKLLFLVLVSSPSPSRPQSILFFFFLKSCTLSSLELLIDYDWLAWQILLVSREMDQLECKVQMAKSVLQGQTLLKPFNWRGPLTTLWRTPWSIVQTCWQFLDCNFDHLRRLTEWCQQVHKRYIYLKKQIYNLLASLSPPPWFNTLYPMPTMLCCKFFFFNLFY